MPFPFRSQAARQKNREAWQQVGLVAGLLAGRHFVGAKDLHYGYWVDGLEPVIRNLPIAQEQYCHFLLSHIPIECHRILDVGCGAGGMAEKLLARGHQVDCVSPSTHLNNQAKALLGDRARVFDCKYEDFSTLETYDAILFCESFQYVKIGPASDKVMQQLRRGGQLIICDFFRPAVDYGSPISGGHYWTEFQTVISSHPLQLIEDIDITPYTAPTFTVIDSAFTEVLQPIWNEVDAAALETHPWIFKLINWFFRHKLAKARRKYFTHERSAANFQKYKTYRLLRYQRT